MIINRQWILIGTGSVLAGLLVDWVGLPAAWLVGPLLLTLLVTLFRPVREVVPVSAYIGAQAVIGMALSASFEPSAVTVLADFWLVVPATVSLVLGLSVASGLLLARVSSLDSATASLGMIPGGAPGMVAMSDDLHADARLVAFMQYGRLVLVGLSASLLSRFVFTALDLGNVAGTGTPTAPVGAGPMLSHSWWEYLVTILGAAVGAVACVRFGVPAGALVGPVIVGVGLGALGIPHGAWPPGVLQAAFALIGIWVGSRFDHDALREVGRLAPIVLAFTVVLMAGCAVIGWVLAMLTGMDLLSAYLATTPGGIDAVTIAALETGADMALVLPIQVLRLLVMVLVGPTVVRWLVGRHRPAQIA